MATELGCQTTLLATGGCAGEPAPPRKDGEHVDEF